MNREALQESLSAVMDNEADELELRRVLAASEEPELRATWSRYQIARAVMHKELLEPRLDIAAAVSAALADEALPEKAAAGRWRGLGRLAVAASVTVAVLAGVRFYNQDELSGAQLAQQAAQPNLVMPQVQGPAVLAGYTTSSEPMSQGPQLNVQQPASGWHEQRLPAYLRQHAQQAAASGTDSALPYARAASLENR
ncbi:anti-sigma factor [Pseudomonas sp. J452]|uniref:sigma-E factor negative regulatory protein n=1 Tax=Pseudomonas sp. J452 TaxID=2898441 RepID=UPI0021AE224D|nr:RseA family anti-sigma factor [Pseudomonas sp. J452]UUY06621.1 anti-sigma factor [Pseudomonas sp. J452]